MFMQQDTAAENNFHSVAATIPKQNRFITSQVSRIASQYSASPEYQDRFWKPSPSEELHLSSPAGVAECPRSHTMLQPQTGSSVEGPSSLSVCSPPGFSNPFGVIRNSRFCAHWNNGGQSTDGPVTSPIDPYRLSPQSLHVTGHLSPSQQASSLAPACYRVFPASTHVSPTDHTSVPHAIRHWSPSSGNSSPLRPWSAAAVPSRVPALLRPRPVTETAKKPPGRLPLGLKTLLSPGPNQQPAPITPHTAHVDESRQTQEFFAIKLQKRIADRRSLLPESVLSELDLVKSNTDMNAYTTVAFPTTMAYIEAMGLLLRKIIEGAHPHHRYDKQFRFDAISVPEVGIADYLERIRCYFLSSPECFVLAMIYIDRLVRLYDGKVVLCSFNIHRILVTAVLIAAKFFDDVYYSNSFYAKIGGLSLKEMNVLESHFLHLIKYDLFVSPREYERYRHNVSLLHSSTAPSVPRSLQLPASSPSTRSSQHASAAGTHRTSATNGSPTSPLTFSRRVLNQIDPTARGESSSMWPGGPLFENPEPLPSAPLAAPTATSHAEDTAPIRGDKHRGGRHTDGDLLISTSSTQCSTPSDKHEYSSPSA